MRCVLFYIVTALGAGILSTDTASVDSLANAWALAQAKNDQGAVSQLQEVAAQYELDAMTAERMSVRSIYKLRSDFPNFRFHDPTAGVGALRFPFA